MTTGLGANAPDSHKTKPRSHGKHRATRPAPRGFPWGRLAVGVTALALVLAGAITARAVSRSAPEAPRGTSAALAADEVSLQSAIPSVPDFPEIGKPLEWHDRPVPEVALATDAAPAAAEAPPPITAKRAVVMDATTGTVLWAANAHEPAAVASTIKILTALTVRRFAGEAEVVTVTDAAAGVGEREIYLAPGEQWSVQDLLAAMLVGSANDAAAALAHHVGGSDGGFGTLATWVAADLGARGTHVVNPHGLDQDGQVSTAYDLAVLTRAALTDPLLAQLVATPEIPFPWPGHEGPRVATNKNKLLRGFPGGMGVKTGGTAKAGNCLVGAAERQGQRFIAVALSSQDPTADNMAMLEWAFRNHRTVELLDAGDEVDGSGRRVSAPLVATVPVGSEGSVEVEVDDDAVHAVLDDRRLASAWLM